MNKVISKLRLHKRSQPSTRFSKSAGLSGVVYRPSESDLQLLQERLGYHFQRAELLEHALTHRSALHGGGDRRSDSHHKLNYERFEFLGDAVVDLVVAHLLIEAHPTVNEGELSKMRAALVNTKTLAEISTELALDSCLIISQAERSSGGNQRPSLLADVFEAVIGALYHEAGFEVAFAKLEMLFRQRVHSVDPSDPKTELQEMLHTLGCPEPEYSLEFREGPEHAPVFVSVVKVSSEVLGRGRGATKKASQQEAAAVALKQLSGFDDIDALYFLDVEAL